MHGFGNLFVCIYHSLLERNCKGEAACMEMGYDINIGVHKLKMWVVGKIEKARHTVRCFLLFSLNCTALLIVHYCAKEICISDKIRIIDQSSKFKVQNCILHFCVH